MLKKKAYFLSIFCIFSVWSFLGCTARLTLTITETTGDSAAGTADFHMTTADELGIIAARFFGSDFDAPLFDVATIREQLSAAGVIPQSAEADGIRAASVRALAPALESLLTDPERPNGERLFSLTQSEETSRAVFSLSPDIIRRASRFIPSESKDFLELFMAPVFTGENMNEEEYAGLIYTAYGAAMGKNLESSFFEFTLCAPGIVTKALCEDLKADIAVDKDKAVFRIPISRLLTLPQKAQCIVEWRQNS